MKETIKQSSKRLKKFYSKIREDILKNWGDYEKGLKDVKAYESKGLKIINGKLKPTIFKHTKEEALMDYKKNRLLRIFHATFESNFKLIEKNNKILKELFKEDEEVLKVINKSYKILKEMFKK